MGLQYAPDLFEEFFGKPVTLGDLRRVTQGLPDSVIVCCEYDGYIGTPQLQRARLEPRHEGKDETHPYWNEPDPDDALSGLEDCLVFS